MLTDEQIKQITSRYLTDTLQELEDDRADGVGIPRDYYEAEAISGIICDELKKLTSALTQGIQMGVLQNHF